MQPNIADIFRIQRVPQQQPPPPPMGWQTLPVNKDAALYPVEHKVSELLRSIGVEGEGLFATRDLPANTIVAEYTGPIILDEDADRSRSILDYVNFTGAAMRYVMDGSVTEYVDPVTKEVRRAWARYCNSAENIGVENATRVNIIREARVLADKRLHGEGELGAYIKTTKPVLAGEEILVSYKRGQTRTVSYKSKVGIFES